MKSNLKGRPIGSVSTVRIKLKDLTKHLTPHATVVVGKLWLEEMGFNIKEAAIVNIVSVTPKPENIKVEVKDLNLND